MPHILVAGTIHEAGVTLLKATPGITFDIVNEVTTESYAPFMARADGVVLRTQPMTAREIAAAPNLKIVSRHGVGYDAVDIHALNARNIPLAIVGDVNSRAVAEHTLMMMLAVARRTVSYDRAARQGHWSVRNRFEAVELNDKILFLIGFGRIGQRVAHLAQAFGMEVKIYDPFVSEETCAALEVDYLPSIEQGLRICDVLSVHRPPAPSGALIGRHEITLMKSSAIIINTARGGLVDECALDAALREGRLYGAGFDVLVDEPSRLDHPLLKNLRFTISPHTAGLTQECAARMAVAAIQNILDCFNGKLDQRLVANADQLKV